MSDPQPSEPNSRVPWWHWINWLALDAVAVAVVWLWMFAGMTGARLTAVNSLMVGAAVVLRSSAGAEEEEGPVVGRRRCRVSCRPPVWEGGEVVWADRSGWLRGAGCTRGCRYPTRQTGYLHPH